jgi:nucleoside transporter
MSVAIRLGVMMFLQYVIWGAWLPLLGRYLGDFLHFSGSEVAWVFGTAAIASITAILFSGQLADRHFSTERFLAVSHLVGGAAMIALAFQKSFWPFLLLMLLHQLMYVPTLSLTNSICFHHLKDAQRQFGLVRLWGTIGWIAASWPYIILLWGKQGPALEAALTSIFWIAGGASLLLAAFSLALPHTPPTQSAESNAPLEAVKLLAAPAVAVLFVVTFMDAAVHQGYFQFSSRFYAKLGVPDSVIAVAMSLGQVAEIGTMALLGVFLKRLGWRRTMTIGILGQAVRFAIYAFGNYVSPSTTAQGDALSGAAWLVISSNLVHGLCYAFFFASVYIFVDASFPKDARASAQSLFNLVILGIGPFAGAKLWGWLQDAFTSPAGIDYTKLFLGPMSLAVLAAAILMIGFHPNDRTQERKAA